MNEKSEILPSLEERLRDYQDVNYGPAEIASTELAILAADLSEAGAEEAALIVWQYAQKIKEVGNSPRVEFDRRIAIRRQALNSDH